MNYKERVGLNIRYYRKQNNYTMKEIAEKVGITEATMQKYEMGQIRRVDVEMLENLANAIGVSIGQLTGWLSKEEEKEAHEKRIDVRNNKWMGLYEKMPYAKQKVVNELITHLSNGGNSELDNKLISAFWKASEKDIKIICSVLDLDSEEYILEKKDMAL